MAFGFIDSRMVLRPNGQTVETSIGNAGGVSAGTSNLQVQLGPLVLGERSKNPLDDLGGNDYHLSAPQGLPPAAPSNGKFGQGLALVGDKLRAEYLPLGRLHDFSMVIVADFYGATASGQVYYSLVSGVTSNGGNAANYDFGLQDLGLGLFSWYFQQGSPGGAGVAVTYTSLPLMLEPGRFEIVVRRLNRSNIAGGNINIVVNGDEVLDQVPNAEAQVGLASFLGFGGVDRPLPTPLNNTNWNGAIFSAHIFDVLVSDIVVESILNPAVNTDSLYGGEIAFYDFESSFVGLTGQMYIESTTSVAEGVWSIDTNASIVDDIKGAFPVSVAPGGSVARIKSIVGGAISGDVIDSAGAPVVGAAVTLLVLGL